MTQPAAAQQAIRWHMLLSANEATEQDKRDFAQWQNASEENATCYARVNQMWQKFDDVDPSLAKASLESAFTKPARTKAKSAAKLATIAMLLTSGLLYQTLKPQHLFVAQHATQIGELRTITLPDNSQLVLNTNTRVEIDYTNKQRNITLLQGELQATVAKDASRPFIVATPQATARALGTQYQVKLAGEITQVTVIESTVEACTQAPWYRLYQLAQQQCVTLHSGETSQLGLNNASPARRVDIGLQASWVTGSLALDDTPLADVLAHLQPYSRARIEFDAQSISNLRVSGVLPLTDIVTSMRLLAHKLPIQVTQHQGAIVVTAKSS